ncbi:NAD(P)H-dependent oxidoreductase [Caulobacter sp. 1776]|uniref:NAD(P)H-dependent oxidoreductase n=1 Tax=Caulobacter sp. 1776 TaxID=3156420 RepID=UPI00339129B4
MRARKILLIDGHPDASADRLVHGLARSYAAAAREAGHTVRVIDLAALDWPLLKTRAEWEAPASEAVAEHQAQMAWCDHLVLLFPLWMGDMPAVVKGYLEMVLRPGFAVKPGPTLGGRSARVIVTMGMPPLVYRLWFAGHAMASLRRNILELCGVRPVRLTYVGPTDAASQTQRLGWVEKVARLGARAA